MNQAQALYQLQEIELQMLSRHKRLQEIAQSLADDQAIAAAQTRVAEAERAITPLRTKARNLELELQSTQQKATATEEQLYSGRVKNTKEMRDMEQEIAALKRRSGELEEHVLATMMSIDEREASQREAQAALEAVNLSRRNDQRQLLDEQSDLQNQMARLRAQREEALKAVTPDSLTKYTALRPKKANQPVAVLQGETCSACGVEQTMAIVRQAQLGQALVTCLSCGRILMARG